MVSCAPIGRGPKSMRMLAQASFMILITLGVATLSSCGSSGGIGSMSSLAGNWQMVLQSNGSSENQSGFLLQSGTALTGAIVLSGQTSCPGVGAAQGQVKGSEVSIGVVRTGQSLQLMGTAPSDGSTMSGNFSILAAGCGVSEVGSWSASHIKPLGGNLSGTFTSGVSGLVFHFTGTIAQGPNTGASNATLSGSMTSTDAPCFQSASIAGLISGTAVVFNLLTTEGLALGQYRATATTDASTLTGTYDFSNGQSQLPPSCQDFGTATVKVGASQ
jgi:hypothetical protein